MKPLDVRLLSENEKTRMKAIVKLVSLSPQEKLPIVDKLIGRLNDPENRVANRAADALIIIGAPAVPAVRTKLSDADVFVRITAISILGQMQPPAKGVASELVAALHDSHPLVREEAALALKKLGIKPPPIS